MRRNYTLWQQGDEEGAMLMDNLKRIRLMFGQGEGALGPYRRRVWSGLSI